jgi:hypothetical protein
VAQKLNGLVLRVRWPEMSYGFLLKKYKRNEEEKFFFNSLAGNQKKKKKGQSSPRRSDDKGGRSPRGSAWPAKLCGD